MKKFILIAILLICSFFTKAQTTYGTSPESGTNPLTTFSLRYKAITPDSLNHLWLFWNGKYNRLVTMTEANQRYAPIGSGVYTAGYGLNLTGTVFKADSTVLRTVANSMSLAQLRTTYYASLTPTAVKTANYTLVAQDLAKFDNTSGNLTATLPNAPTDKTLVAVKLVIQGGTNTVVINTAGGDVFNKTGGGTSYTIKLLNQSVLMQYQASGGIWNILSDDLPLGQLDTRFAPYSTQYYTTQQDKSPPETTPADLSESGYNSFAWMGQDKSGTYVMIYRHATSHTSHDGVLEIRTKPDGGAWSSPTVIVTGGGVTNKSIDNFAAGFSSTGRLILSYNPYLSGTFTGTMVTYTDDITNWSTAVSLPSFQVPYLNIITIGGGKLLMPGYTLPTSTGNAQYAISSDNGTTWTVSNVGSLVGFGANETAFQYFADNVVIAISRSSTGIGMFYTISTDNAATFSTPYTVLNPISFTVQVSPWLTTYLDAFGNRAVKLYYADRTNFNIVSISGSVKDVINNGASGFNTNTIESFAYGTAVDGGYPSFVHPNNSPSGIGAYYQGLTSTTTTQHFFVSRVNTVIGNINTTGNFTINGSPIPSGTVTNVSGVNTNDFTWSIANASSTPAITLKLGQNVSLSGGTSNAWNPNWTSIDFAPAFGNSFFARNNGATQVGMGYNSYHSTNGGNTWTTSVAGNSGNIVLSSTGVDYYFRNYAAAGNFGAGTSVASIDSTGKITANSLNIAGGAVIGTTLLAGGNGVSYSELITNTTDRNFTGANNWTGSNWTTSSNTFLHATGAADVATLSNSFLTGTSIFSGRQYLLTVTVNTGGTGNLTFALGGTGVTTAAGTTSTITITAGADNANLTVTPTTTTFSGSFTNISIKPVISALNYAPNGSLSIGSNANNTNVSAALTVSRSPVGQGIITVTAGGTTVTGTGTNFTNDLDIGETITANGETHTISAITQNAATGAGTLTTDAWTNAFTGAYTITRTTPFSVTNNGKVTVSSKNGTAMSISSTEVNSTTQQSPLALTTNYTNTSASSATSIVGASSVVTINANTTKDLTNSGQGISGFVNAVSVGNSGTAYTVATLQNYYNTFSFSAALGTLTTGWLYRNTGFSNTGHIVNMIGLNTAPFISGGSGVIDNQTHILIGSNTPSSGNWAIDNKTGFDSNFGTGNIIGPSTSYSSGGYLQLVRNTTSGRYETIPSTATIHSNSTTTGAATTRVTVTIGSTMANTNYLASITPKNLLTGVNYYIDPATITTTTFDVVFVTALTGSINFDWGVTP